MLRDGVVAVPVEPGQALALCVGSCMVTRVMPGLLCMPVRPACAPVAVAAPAMPSRGTGSFGQRHRAGHWPGVGPMPVGWPEPAAAWLCGLT